MNKDNRQNVREAVTQRVTWHLDTARKHTSIEHEVNTVAGVVAAITTDGVESNYTEATLIQLGQELNILCNLYMSLLNQSGVTNASL